MTLARELIADGRVPEPGAFVVEAMFSEHDLPLEGDPCATRFCLRGALGLAESGEGEASSWLQVGMSSTIDPESFERPSLTVIATVDVSGSMGWDYGDGTPGDLAGALLHRVASELGSRDRIAIVTYGSRVRTRLDLTLGSEQESIHGAIDRLGAGGSTNMEAGLQRAYELGRRAAADGATEETRVLLFTDVRPNVGATGGSEFEGMVASGADDGVGITVLALGLGLDPALTAAMSHLRGANAFSLTAPGDVPALMEDDWPWMVSPLAYDLSLKVRPSEGYEVTEGYGFPASADGETSLDASTVFLSRRKGALLVRFAGAEVTETSAEAATAGGATQGFADFSVEASLSYTTPEGEPRFADLTLGVPESASAPWFEQTGVARTVALALLVSGMREAAEAYGTDPEGAIRLLEAVRERFAVDVGTLEPGDSVLAELALVDALLANMRAGGDQQSPYGV